MGPARNSRWCAWRFGRRPSSDLYIRWCRRRHARARELGLPPPRIPTYESLRVRYGGWLQTMAAAAITDTEIAYARSELAARNSIVLAATARAGRPDHDELATAHDGFDALTEHDLAEIGLDPDAARRAALRRFAPMPLGDAARLAVHLGGSLDWLAGRQPHPGVVTGLLTRLDAPAIGRLRLDAGVSETTLLDATGCTLSAWRRLLTARYEPSLELVATLAGVLDRACGEICR